MVLYTVRVTKNDSVSAVEYKDILYIWWQHNGQLLVLEKGAREKDREYIYYPVSALDHVHVKEQI